VVSIKEEALSYKKQLEETTAKIDDFKNFDLTKELDETVKEVEKSEKKLEKKIGTIRKEDNA